MNNLLLEEQEFSFEYFNSKIAYKIGKAISDKIIANNLAVAVNIYAYNKTLYHFTNDNTIPDKENWLIRKRNIVLHFHHSSKYINEKLNNDQTLLISKYGLNIENYAAIAGSFPIIVKNCGVIGAISISGLEPNDDHQLIINTLKILKI
ncbi:MAG: heme-binding protein [Erysipelotrichaceae bacterium]|nr:heme-binding protein [Erysipelotrichaceae bacterium]